MNDQDAVTVVLSATASALAIKLIWLLISRGMIYYSPDAMWLP